MLDDALNVRVGHVGPPFGWIAAALPDVLPWICGNVAQAHGVFQHLPSVAETLMNRRCP